MSALPARHLRAVNVETGELVDSTDCPHCADARAEAEIWEQRVLTLERQVKRLTEDKDAKTLRDRDYPAAVGLFEEWQRECAHPKSKLDIARTRLALTAVKLYKGEREKLSLVIQQGKHLAWVDETGHKHDSFGLLFRDAEQIEKRATAYYRWRKAQASSPSA